MNTNLGLIGRKMGTLQIFDENGDVIRVTAIEAGPCVVVGKRTPERDGYSAIQLGFGERKEKHLRKAQKSHYAKAEVQAPQTVREFRLPLDLVEKYEVGQTLLPADVFKEGQHVDVCGTSKGRGFTGVMKRWNFAGAGTNTHGTHEYRRHGGSIGTNLTPGRTLPNLKMPGQHGNKRTTLLNLRVAKLVEDKPIVLIRGAVPGPRSGLVTIRSAVKKKTPAN